MFICQRCRVANYCGKECQEFHWAEHRVLCDAITELSKKDPKPTEDDGQYIAHLSPRDHAKLIKLVGRKCTVSCLLNGKAVKCLWDTGAQVSILSEAALKDISPKEQVQELSVLIDEKFNFLSNSTF